MAELYEMHTFAVGKGRRVSAAEDRKMKNIQVETLVLGMMAVNCYLVMHKETKKMVIIDPGAQPERVTEKIEKMGAQPVAILLTHGHFDHIGAVETLREHFGIPVCGLDKEREIFEDAQKNLSAMFGDSMTVTADRMFYDGERVSLGSMEIRVLHTPGHTVGGACYYMPEEDVLFSGDTLFCASVGRTDFPTGSMSALRTSIHTKLFVLPEATVVYPGHNEATDISYEKRYNPY